MEVNDSAILYAPPQGGRIRTSAATTETPDKVTAVNPEEKASAATTQNNSDLALINALQQRDRVVRAHENAHIAAGGSLIKGGANFTYAKGPDGRLYATGGDVSIDTSAVKGNPEATLAKAQKIRSAALAPAQPSATDRTVASQASQLANAARSDIAAEISQALETEQASRAEAASESETTEVVDDDATIVAENKSVSAKSEPLIPSDVDKENNPGLLLDVSA